MRTFLQATLCLALAALVLLPAPAQATHAQATTACATPGPSPVALGCAQAVMSSVVWCGPSASGWTCVVDYTLTLTVTGPANCGAAWSGPTGDVLACATVLPARASATGSATYAVPPGGLWVAVPYTVCSGVGGVAQTCESDVYVEYLPGP